MCWLTITAVPRSLLSMVAVLPLPLRSKTKTASAPAAAPAGTAVGVYRAYTSLKNWGESPQNRKCEHYRTVTEDDVNPSMDLVTANTIMMVACYGDGEDTTPVYIDDWSTGPDNYIKIYTPTSLSEVGTSQRHNGAWDTSAYRISNDGSKHATIAIRERYVRIDGLQVDAKNLYNGDTKVGFQVADDNADAAVEVQISNSMIRMSGAAPSSSAYGIGILNGFGGANSLYVAKVWNNIIYGYAVNGGGGTCMYAQDNGTVYAYNNTCVGGSGAANGITKYNNVDFYAKNNISIDSTDPYNGTFHGDSTNNVSDTGDAPGSNPINGEPTFVNKAGNDYHLNNSDTVAQGAGADLDGDAILSITDDIDGGARDVTQPDIGADEAAAVELYRSVGTTATALESGTGNGLTISGSTATFDSGLADNIGVGDVIQYDSDGNSSIDALAFIHRSDRLSDLYGQKQKRSNTHPGDR